MKKNNKATVNASCKQLMSLASFKSSTDLSVLFGGKRRKNSKLLKFIESKLETINKVQIENSNGDLGPDSILVLAELYYALDRWQVLAGNNDSAVNTRRTKGIEGLYAQVVKLLSYQLQIPINQLPNWLTENFTVGMTDHGYEVDYQNRSALYYKEQDREVYRLKIVNGVIKQKQWWAASKKDKWVNMNTEFIQTKHGSPGTIKDKHCGYVLSVVGDFYSGPHKSGTLGKHDGQYHSSYMGGRPVLCAGEIQVVNGRVKHLNTGSGHYGPAKGYLLNVINALTVSGVSETSYKVSYHGAPSAVSAAAMRKRLETVDVKVGGDDVSHLKSTKAAKYNNGVKAGLVARMNKITAELAVIAHFGTSDHTDGIKRTNRGRRAVCAICSKAGLDGQMQQDRFKKRNAEALRLEFEKLEKIVARIK